ncbi:MAG TPA: DUF1214 domain-containing protein [Pirellulales bacterium]|jgi:hypothetical protein
MHPRILFSLLVIPAIGQQSASVFAAESVSGRAANAAQVAESLQQLISENNFPKLDSDTALRNAARQAYLWAWPMVYVRNCHAALSWLRTSGISGGAPVAPPNRLCMLTDRVKSSMTAVACPNPDVIYGFGILDLQEDPVILQVPDFGERFWLFQLGDQRTDGFAQVGKMYGTKPGFYLIAGPDWQGVAPPSVTGVLRCPTKIGYVLPRVLLSDESSKTDSLDKTLGQIQIYPLSQFRGRLESCDWSRKRWLPSLSGGKPRGRVVPKNFFEVLPEVLATVPPLPGEESLYAYFGELIERAAGDERVRQLLTDTAVVAEQELIEPLFEFRRLGQPAKHNWTTTVNGATFGADYLTRAAVAKSNIFVNQPTETKYFYQDLDSEGQRLSGDNSYRITFPAGQLPPTKGHWSLTLYNENHTLHPNILNRHSVGVATPQIQSEPDGSVTILVQQNAPPDQWQDNWLPAPAGKFSLYLRVYWPEDEVVTGQWSPPEVVNTAPVQYAVR